MRVFTFLLLFLLSSCITLRDRNGGRHSNFAPVSDHYRQFMKNGISTNILSLDSGQFILQNESGNFQFRYLNVADVVKAKDKFGKCLFVFWLPSCPGQADMVKFAKSNDTFNFPIFLVSVTYDIEQIQSLAERSGYKRDIFILPNSFGDKIVLKKINFIRECCPSCYSMYRDELASAAALYIDSTQHPKVILNIDSLRLGDLCAPVPQIN